MDISVAETLLRVVIAAGLAALIGLEREWGQQPAGLRTHTLLSLGACLFTLAGTEVAGADPSRVAAQVASGVGFIGAGAILREQFRVKGVTTAASLWIAAAIGVAAGFGAYVPVTLVTLTALVVLVAVKWLEEEFIPRRRRQEITLTLSSEVKLSDTVAAVDRIVGPIEVVWVNPGAEGGQRLKALARPQQQTDIVTLAERLQSVPGVTGVDLEASAH